MQKQNNKLDRSLGITAVTFQDVHDATNDLRKIIDECPTRTELENHYATKAWVVVIGITAFTALISGYFYLTPKLMDS